MPLNSYLGISAHAKINWCLAVTGRTANGYHLLDMLMQRVSICDTLYAAPAKGLCLRVLGQPVGGAQEDNLVLRAALALHEYAPGAGARLTLTKRIPQGAGLGGGSSDAAAALKLLNRLWRVNLSRETLRSIALRLGADVPFFLDGFPARVQGIGEQLTPAPLPGDVPLVLVKDTPGLNTGLVYRRSDESPYPPIDVPGLLESLRGRQIREAACKADNALYPAAVSLSPRLDTIKRAVEASGALYTQMTGSGAVIYGVYSSDAQAGQAARKLRSMLPDAYIACARTIS